jgi:hypothetical protein
LFCSFRRGGVCRNAQRRINVGQTVQVTPDYGNLKALAVELMCKSPANAATGACYENDGCHGIP